MNARDLAAIIFVLAGHSSRGKRLIHQVLGLIVKLRNRLRVFCFLTAECTVGVIRDDIKLGMLYLAAWGK
ncbi:MAG: hypothetical protein ACJAU1_000235 [Psychromonas sp.]|jgi:hypothetical protein